MKRISFSERAKHCQNALAKKLFLLMSEKKTNLSLSADVTHCHQLLELAELIGPEICVLKTHVDILGDFTFEFTQKLTAIAKKHRFLIFEDRKFADIGNTVKHQYENGVYKIVDWADITNAHSVSGPGVISGLMAATSQKERGLLLLAGMSSEKNLMDETYAQKTLKMAEQFPEFVMGFVAQHKINDDPRWIYLTPGVQLKENSDNLGQQYITPETAVKQNQTDIIIVGRGIFSAKDPLMEAKKYREAGWSAL